MSFELNDLDKNSRPKAHLEELDHYKFKKTNGNKVAVRISTDEDDPLQVSEGLSLPKFDTVLGTYPNTTTEVYTYSLDATEVAVVTVIYSNAAKTQLVSLVKTVP